MRKKLLLCLVCSSLIFTACSTNDVKDAVKKAGNAVHKIASGGAASIETANINPDIPTPTATLAPKEQVLSTGKKGTVGNWKITIKKAEIKKKIQNGEYRYFKPSNGKRFITISLSVRNTGKKNEEFLPRFGYEDKMIQATLITKKKEEYKPTELLSYNKDLVTRTIQSRSTEKGIITFEVPKKVANQKKKLKLKIGTSKDYIIYPLK